MFVQVDLLTSWRLTIVTSHCKCNGADNEIEKRNECKEAVAMNFPSLILSF